MRNAERFLATVTRVWIAIARRDAKGKLAQ